VKDLTSLVLGLAVTGCSATVIHEIGPADAQARTDSSAPTPPDSGVAPPPQCPMDPGASGLPCGNVVAACSGFGSCGNGYVCHCTADGLWHCEGDSCPEGDGGVTPPLDSSAPPLPTDAGAPPPDASTTCSLVGTWTTGGPTVGMFVIRFQSDGQWQAARNAAALTTPFTGGTYTVSGDQITLQEGLVAGSPFDCSATDEGVYTYSFAPTCVTAALTLVSDPCRTRGAALNGVTLSP